MRPPPSSTLFPYTTLFRSTRGSAVEGEATFVGGLANPGVDEFAILGVRLLSEADRKSTRLNSSHRCISYAVFCLKKKRQTHTVATAGQYHSVIHECQALKQ